MIVFDTPGRSWNQSMVVDPALLTLPVTIVDPFFTAVYASVSITRVSPLDSDTPLQVILLPVVVFVMTGLETDPVAVRVIVIRFIMAVPPGSPEDVIAVLVFVPSEPHSYQRPSM